MRFHALEAHSGALRGDGVFIEDVDGIHGAARSGTAGQVCLPCGHMPKYFLAPMNRAENGLTQIAGRTICLPCSAALVWLAAAVSSNVLSVAMQDFCASLVFDLSSWSRDSAKTDVFRHFSAQNCRRFWAGFAMQSLSARDFVY